MNHEVIIPAEEYDRLLRIEQSLKDKDRVVVYEYYDWGQQIDIVNSSYADDLIKDEVKRLNGTIRSLRLNIEAHNQKPWWQRIRKIWVLD